MTCDGWCLWQIQLLFCLKNLYISLWFTSEGSAEAWRNCRVTMRSIWHYKSGGNLLSQSTASDIDEPAKAMTPSQTSTPLLTCVPVTSPKHPAAILEKDANSSIQNVKRWLIHRNLEKYGCKTVNVSETSSDHYGSSAGTFSIFFCVFAAK